MAQEDSYWEEPKFINDLINQLPAAIFWKNANSVFLGCNQYFADLAQLPSPKDIIGKTDYDMPWGKHEGDLYRRDDQEVMHSKQPKLNIEESQTLADGKIITLLTNKIPLFFKGDVVGILGIFNDITERKIIEEKLLQAKEKVSKAEIAKTKAEAATLISKNKAAAEEDMRRTVMVLVGDIVHDLRTPLATIRIVADILENILPVLLEVTEEAKALGSKKVALLPKKKWDYLHHNTPVNSIKKSIIMIDNFINSTLNELANAQKEQSIELFRASLTKCSSRRIIENTLEAYPFSDNTVIKQNISYEFYLMGNSILIMKILFNLIKNAFEQILLNGKGDITITTEKSSEGNLIKIKDTAGGAPPEVVSNFFKGYFTTKKNGTGVGLAFCKKTMENMGGDILCHSIDGKSMEFTLIFPVVRE